MHAVRGRVAAPPFTDARGNGSVVMSRFRLPFAWARASFAHLRNSVNVLSVMMNPNRASLGIAQRVGHPQLDEGLTRDTDASGFLIDRAQ